MAAKASAAAITALKSVKLEDLQETDEEEIPEAPATPKDEDDEEDEEDIPLAKLVGKPAAAATRIGKPAAAATRIGKPAAAATRVGKPRMNLMSVNKKPAGAASLKTTEASLSRDQAKVRKLAQVRDALPDDVKKLLDDAHQHPTGKRARETDIVNNMFTKEGGKLVPNWQSPWFSAEIKQRKTKFGNDERRGVHFDIMKERFKDGQRGLEAAISSGAVEEWTVDGQRFCATREVVVGSSHSVTKTNLLTSGKGITPEQHKLISDAVDRMQFGFSLSGADQKKAASGEVPYKAHQKIGEAIVVLEKCLKDATRTYDKLSQKTLLGVQVMVKDNLEVQIEEMEEDNRHLNKMYRFKKCNDGTPYNCAKIQHALGQAALHMEAAQESNKAAKAFVK